MPAPPLSSPTPKGPASGRTGGPGFDQPAGGRCRRRLRGSRSGVICSDNGYEQVIGWCWRGSFGAVPRPTPTLDRIQLASLPVLALSCPSWGPADRRGLVVGPGVWMGAGVRVADR